ncbi:cellulase family glycosylhydrolase [Streptosporangiaceae bacterium NEAU-GS5]|nr:cellulase family glycosylhydrolase [Streptosporangiaceae bacterium NEAU-GS5]
MKGRLALVVAAMLSLLTSMLVAGQQPASAAVGLHISGRNIVEANGSNFILRGTSHAHTWFSSQTSSIANIKAKGANVVRIVLSGGRWQPANSASDVANVISLCKAAKLICVLEDHDTTGFGEQSGAISLDSAVNYWLSLQSVLTGQENYVIINIGNEPFGNNAVTPNWTQATSSAITRLRSAGFQHLLMVDAPNWGQDWQFQMRDNAASVFSADPQRNTVFSVHMYGVFDTAAEINAYYDAFQTAGLPLVVGEFGFMHSDGNPDEDTIMGQAQARGIGYMGWSWSGNGGGVEYLDQVTNFDPNQLTSWGTRLFNGANGVATTAREATIFGGGTPDTTAPTTPTGLTASGTTATGTTLSWTASTDNVAVTGYDILRAPGASGGTFAQVGASTTTSFTNTGLTASTTYRYQVRARDAAGNTSAVSNTASVTTSSGGGTGACTAVPTVQSQWQTGYVIQPMTIINTSTSTITSWTVTFTLPAGHALTGSWNATVTTSGQTVTAKSVGHNGTLAPGASTTSFGFQASRPSGNTSLPSGYTCTTP